MKITKAGCPPPRKVGIWLVVLNLSLPSLAEAQECSKPNPDWIFCDDFESDMDQTGQLGRWDDQGLTPSNLVITMDPAKVHGGKRSLEVTAHKGLDSGGGPIKWFDGGHDVLHVRFFTR